MQKLNVWALGLALGIVWGVSILILGFLATLYNYGTPYISLLSSIYIGYKATILGSVIGCVWGFVDAFIGGVILAWLYNKISG